MAPPARNPLLVILAVVLTVTSVAILRKVLEPREKVIWITNLDQARRQAAETGRPIFLYFSASWCPPCQQLKKTTFADQSVADALGKWIAVKIDVDDQPAVADQFQVQSLPRFVLLSPDGDIRANAEGFLTSQEFLDFLANRR